MKYKLLGKIFSKLFHLALEYDTEVKEQLYRQKYDIHPDARINYIEKAWFMGNIKIGANSYFNDGRIISGPNSKVVIGEWCAIGHNVNIIAWTHDTKRSTGPEDERSGTQKDIIIGNNVWIGTNVFIREGVRIGQNSIVGANSVVTKNVPENAIVGGVPAKVIRYKEV